MGGALNDETGTFGLEVETTAKSLLAACEHNNQV